MIPVTRSINGEDVPLYVLRQVSDKAIIHDRTISNTTGLPNPGPDQEYLPIFTDEAPKLDPDLQRVVRAEGPNEATLQWEITLTVEDKTKDELLQAVEAAKLAEAQKQAPVQVFTESTIIVLAAILGGGKPSPEDEANVIALATKLLANRAKAAADKLIVDAGGKPDLKDGWADVAVVDAIPVVVVP